MAFGVRKTLATQTLLIHALSFKSWRFSTAKYVIFMWPCRISTLCINSPAAAPRAVNKGLVHVPALYVSGLTEL